MITLKQCRGIGLVIVGVLSSLLSGLALAESYMYLTNNTMQTLTLSTQQTGHDNIRHGDEWQQLATEVPSLGTVKFLRFNRDQGITWGKEYIFTTVVLSGQPLKFEKFYHGCPFNLMT